MIINFTPCAFNTQSRQKLQPYHNFAPLRNDTVSFSAMKKSKFDGFDLSCINSFKAPLEKFNSHQDLNIWAKNKMLEKSDLTKYKNSIPEDNEERLETLENWIKGTQDLDPPLTLIIFNSISRNIRPDNREQPLLFNRKALNKTIIEMTTNKNYDANFEKLYQVNLRKHVLNSNDIKVTKWVELPSYSNDSKNFSENKDKLRILSRREWCTKSNKDATSYLKKGNFHIYIKDGTPKAAVHFANNNINEIQGRRDNFKVPIDYVDEIEDLFNSKNVMHNFSESKIAKEKVHTLRSELSDAIKINDRKTIFKKLGYTAKIDKEGKLTLSHYCQPDNNFTFEDLNIDENRLLKGLVKITGRADFRDTTATEINELRYIGGSADFTKCGKISLNSLKTIKGDLILEKSKIKTFPELTKIEGHLLADNSDLCEMPKLKIIGKNASLNDSVLTDISSLKSIGGKVFIVNSKLTPEDFQNIKTGGRIFYE